MRWIRGRGRHAAASRADAVDDDGQQPIGLGRRFGGVAVADRGVRHRRLPDFYAAHEMSNVFDADARPERVRELGLPTTGFAEWAARNMR